MARPSIFVSHGSPMLALTPSPARSFLESLGETIGKPKAVVVASPHFPAREPTVVSDPAPGMIYDFGGFPDDLYRLRYSAPGDPALAEEVAALIKGAGLPAQLREQRGFDHGTWVPAMIIWPDADVPIVQLSVEPYQDAAYHLALGRALAPLRERDILVLGTGAMTHNLHELMSGGLKRIDAPAEDWAVAFADWVADRAAAGAIDDLVAYAEKAPSAARAHPADDHFLPFFVALGAAGEGAKGERIHASMEYGALSMDAYSFA